MTRRTDVMAQIDRLIPDESRFSDAEGRFSDWLRDRDRPATESIGRSGLLPLASAAQRLLDGGEPRDAVVGILIALADKLLATGNCRC